MTLGDIAFSYGNDHILQALLDNYKRQSLKKAAYVKQYGDLYLQRGSAISYRFLLDKKGWRVFVSIAQKFKKKSAQYLGAIGIDINSDHLAVCENR